MTVYLDTSAFVKLFVEEVGSEAVRALATVATPVVSALGRVEARAAFARMRAGRRLSTDAAEALAASFERWWAGVAVVAPTGDVLARSASLAGVHALRGSGAVHLASALALPAAHRPVFACFDAELSRAARREGLALPEDW